MLTVVTGPPCVGKSHYIRERAQPGDIVIDMDRLALALGSDDTHNHNEHIRFVTIACRRAAINAAFLEHERGATVWIAQVSLTPQALQRYIDYGASIIHLQASAETLHARARAERPVLWHALIDEWAPLVPNEGLTAHNRLWFE